LLNRRDFILQSATASGALVLAGSRVASGASSAGSVAKTDASQPAFTINADTPWIVSDAQPEPIERALVDVQRDWYKVFGHLPVVLAAVPANWSGPVICFGRNVTGVSISGDGPESFVLKVQSIPGSPLAFVASGVDVRGSIYAAYAFSEQILGVDPWWYWTDKEPARQESITVPVNLSDHFGSPTFKYRGWFINDEDQLHGFSPDPMRENSYSLEMLDRVCETLLRFRGNMLVPATYPFPDERCQELTSRRGLILNMHHILAVGLNTFKWPKDVPFSFDKHPEIMERYWQTCIDAFKDKEVIWTVGYRGKGDRPFWIDEPEIDTPAKRGDVISRAIAKQVELIRKVQPNAPIIANMWLEGATLNQQGLLKFPAGVTVVWPDNGAGTIRDNGQVQAGQGIYYHTMMFNRVANHFCEFVPPERIYRELGRFVAAKATEFFLVNVCCIRPVPLTTECVMRIAWDASPYMGKPDAANQKDFLLSWNRRQFGADVAPELADIWTEYYAIPGRQPNIILNDGNGSVPEAENSPHNRLRMLSEAVVPFLRSIPLTAESLKNGAKQFELSPQLAQNWGYSDLFGTAASLTVIAERQLKFASTNRAGFTPLLAKAESLGAKIPAQRRSFYGAYLLTELGILAHSNEMLEYYSQALLALAAGNREGAIQWVEKSLSANNAFFASLRQAELGKWSGWYFNEGLLGFDRTRDQIRLSLAALRGETAPPVRLNLHDYHGMEQYQERFSKNFPLLYGADHRLPGN